jgi:hypothetical protein
LLLWMMLFVNLAKNCNEWVVSVYK